MIEDALRSNYSAVGSSLIERIYSNDFLSIAGIAGSDRLAKFASVTANDALLDIGSGLGGPAMHLAASIGCYVVGLDLVESNVTISTERAAQRGLADKAQFQAGNAMALPFEANTFDVIWGQDAWCHVPDKSLLIQEAARVAKPGARIAFTDWLQIGPMTDDDQAAVFDGLSAPNMAGPDDYRSMLKSNGFEIQRDDDISAEFITHYAVAMDRLRELEAEITAEFSPKVFNIVWQKNNCVREAFDAGQIGGGLFIANRT
jgi:ubiquinone/menaquinone biosynthesis C-methylase UbiE